MDPRSHFLKVDGTFEICFGHELVYEAFKLTSFAINAQSSQL
jgi:hypothetical protein